MIKSAHFYREETGMSLPQVRFLGDALPTGWHRPTPELVARYLLFLQEGIAPPSAPQLYRPAMDAGKSDLGTDAIQQLTSYVRPDSDSRLKAVGMAYPQLARAEIRSVRVLAAQTGMRNLQAESRTANVTVLINPSYTPIKASGQELRVEACFSAPGIGVRIMRWREIMLHRPGLADHKAAGTDAWILQHEIDHLDGFLCTDVAARQRSQLYYVPPEWYRLFTRDGFWPGWPTLPPGQYDAMRSGNFDLADYARFL
jgi:peptide deformylase